MKKILVVDFNGTSAVYTHYFSQGLANEENEVKILGKKRLDFLDVFENLNIYEGYNSGFKLLDYILNWFWLFLHYRKFDLIIFQWLQLLKYTSIEIKLLSYLQTKIKTVYILHNLYPHNTKNHKIISRYNQLYKTCKNIAVHTDKLKKIISNITPNTKVMKIEHGFFFKEFRKKTPKKNTIKCLMIGYISKYKGIEDALKVVKILKESNTIISLEIIGLASTEYLDILTKKIYDYKIDNQVQILSKEVSTKFLINKINGAKMLWLPYKNISQSGVTYTSIGLGKPFVGYNVGNFKSSFGNTGIANISEQNNSTAFSKAVIEVIENEEYYLKNIQKLSLENLWKLNKIILN